MGLRDYLHYKQAHHRKEAQGQQRTSSDGSADASIVSCGAVQTDAVLPLYGIITIVWHHYGAGTTTSDRRRTIRPLSPMGIFLSMAR